MPESKDPLATGDDLILKYYQDGDIGDVESAVVQYRLALAGAADRKADDARILAQLCLADSLRIQFEEGVGGEDKFQEALSLAEEALSSTEGWPTHRLRALEALGNICQRRNAAIIPDVLRRAIQAFSQLVDLALDSHRTVLVNALARKSLAVATQYDHTGDTKSVSEANAILDRALCLTSARDMATDPALTLAFIRARYYRSLITGSEHDLVLAMEAVQGFIANASPTDPYLHVYWASLGFYLRRKYLLNPNDEDLDAGIVAYDEARKRVRDYHPLWHIRYGNYASALHRRYSARSTLGDLNEAIRMTRAVIEHMARMKHHGRQMTYEDTYVGNLGLFLEASYGEYGKAELLDEAISLHLRNLPATRDLRKSDARTSLARAYTQRFESQGRTSDLEAAISLLEQAHRDAVPGQIRISVTKHLVLSVLRRKENVLSSHDAQGWHHSLLGCALRRRFVKTGSRQDLEESVHCQQLALQYFPTGLNGAETLFLLGMAQRELFGESRDTAVGHHSVNSFQQALSLLPFNHFEKSKYLVELGRAQLALANEVSDGEISKALTTFCSAAKETRSWINDRYGGAVWWAKLAHKEGLLSKALEAYRLAISFLPEMASFGLEHELRMRSLSKQAPDLCQDAAACAIQLGELELAVELLEAGKSVVWNMGQELRTDLSRLDEVAPALASELAETSWALESRRSWGQDMKDADRELERRRLQRLASRRTELIGLVRQESGFENFLLPTSYAQLSKASVGGPVVILNTSIYRCDALIVRVDRGPVLVPLLSLRHDQARQDATVISALSQVSKDKQGLLFAESVLTKLLRRLWETVGKPVYVAVMLQSPRSGRTPRVWWCPSGPMSFLPIHACGLLNGMQPDLSDLVTPTLSALIRARGPTSRSQEMAPRMLAIIQPNLPDRPPLPSAMEELEVLRTFPGTTMFLVGPSGTVSAVQKELPSHNWIHVSSHGRQDFYRPMASSLALHDGPLTLLHLTNARLPDAEFAFLSACHSARGTEWIADESMHLAAGFLFAGYKSIVATSRAIADKDAPIVAQAFYAYLSRDGKAPEMTEAAEALQHAIRALRATGVPALRWAPFIHIGL